MKQEVAIQDSRAMEAMERSPADLIAQVRKINETMRAVMRSGEHYGVIPGTNKPTLLKPGAEKLLLLFRLAPDYESVDHYDGDHLTVKSKCTLYHIPTGSKLGSGEGSCSTKESKYALRFGKPNDKLPDQYNTVLKMSNKRALVAAVLNTTAASDIFTQDIEDMPEFQKPAEPQKKADNPKQHDLPENPDQQSEIMVTGLISKVEAKSGMKNGKEWLRYGITIAGEVYGTFDKKLGEFAESCKQNMSIVDLYWMQEGKFKTVEQISVSEKDNPFDN
jgi:hypothetical protein